MRLPGLIVRALFLATLLSAFPATGNSQAHRGPIAFDHLTPENGLSHNTVYSIIQDRSGLIWIGTRYGLNRYDGYECRVFLPTDGDSGTLAGPTVLALMEGRQGKIWVGHREAGISVWDPTEERFARFPAGPDAEIGPHLRLTWRPKGAVTNNWIGTSARPSTIQAMTISWKA